MAGYNIIISQKSKIIIDLAEFNTIISQKWDKYHKAIPSNQKILIFAGTKAKNYDRIAAQ
ncbi:MAG: hypothetical protein J6Y24_10265 [Bacteroidales bacterium]|nr:hypothetical protein [Bacteroidales bacterium]